MRVATRAVRWLHARKLGWVLGHRILVLHHTGRRSGRRYATPLEVIGRTPAGGYIVISGFGAGDWLRNLAAGGPATVAVGTTGGPVTARLLALDDAVDVLAAYERRHVLIRPLVRRLLYGCSAGPTGAPRPTAPRGPRLPMVALDPA